MTLGTGRLASTNSSVNSILSDRNRIGEVVDLEVLRVTCRRISGRRQSPNLARTSGRLVTAKQLGSSGTSYSHAATPFRSTWYQQSIQDGEVIDFEVHRGTCGLTATRHPRTKLATPRLPPCARNRQGDAHLIFLCFSYLSSRYEHLASSCLPLATSGRACPHLTPLPPGVTVAAL